MPIRTILPAWVLALALTAVAAAPAVALAPAPGPVLPPVPPGPVPAPLPVPVRIAYVTGGAQSLPSVWIAGAAGQEPKLLGPGDQPLLAPNGLSVAASRFGSGSNSEMGPAIGIYPATGAPVVNYLSLATSTAQPLAWSPDSRYLAVAFQSTSVTNIARNSGLAVIDTATGTVRTIAGGQISGASFAPDGSDRIAFARSGSLSLTAPANIYISGPDGSGLTRLTSDGRSLNPVWGPHFIAYDHERLRRNDASVYQIWLRSPAGGRARQLTHLRVASLVSGLVPQAFSANGSRLLAEFEGQDTSEAWTVRVGARRGRRSRRLTVHGQPVMAAGISRDGGSVLVDEGSFEEPPSRGRVALIPFGGGRAKVLIGHGSAASWNG
jgi:hypothetical protein